MELLLFCTKPLVSYGKVKTNEFTGWLINWLTDWLITSPITQLIIYIKFQGSEYYGTCNWSSLYFRADSRLAPSQWASYQIRKTAGCACAGNAGNVSPRRRFQRKLLVSDPGMHHGTCVTHVTWCMSGSLTCVDGENVPGIPGACAPAILRIWQEAHERCYKVTPLLIGWVQT